MLFKNLIERKQILNSNFLNCFSDIYQEIACMRCTMTHSKEFLDSKGCKYYEKNKVQGRYVWTLGVSYYILRYLASVLALTLLIKTFFLGIISNLICFWIHRNLDDNKIYHFELEAFRGVENLTSLLLKGNRFETLDPRVLQNLQNLKYM